MNSAAPHENVRIYDLPLTAHASRRMTERRLSRETVGMVMTYGRVARVRGANIYAVGRKEVEEYLADGVNLARLQGVQVVCTPDGLILTVYRNNNLRGLRPRDGRRHCRRSA